MDPAAGARPAEELRDAVDDGLREGPRQYTCGGGCCASSASSETSILRTTRLHVTSLTGMGLPRRHSSLVTRGDHSRRGSRSRPTGSTRCGCVRSWRSAKDELPRHIAVLCDGNRRWARDAGHDDVSYGYRMGAAKIAEMLRWCQETGIEMATVYLLSTENLQRDPRRTRRADRDHHRRRRGDLRARQPLERAHRRRPRAARRGARAAAARRRRLDHGRRRRIPRQRRRRLRRTAGDRRRRPRAAGQGTGQRRDRRAARSRPSPSTPSRRTCTPRVSPIPTSSSGPRGSSGCRASCCGRAPIRRCGSPRRTGRRSGGSTSCARCATTPCGTAATARLGHVRTGAWLRCPRSFSRLSWWLGLYLLARDPA